MTDMKYILYSLLVGMMMVSCSSADDIADDANSQQAAQQVDLLVSVGSKASQSNKQSVSALRRAATFLGMEDLVAIPFHTDGAAVAPTDHPYLDMVSTTEESSRVEGHNNYYVDHCFLMPGTDRMLVYGKSKPSPSADQTVNGVLSALPTVRTKLEDIRFSLTSIRNTTEVHTEAQALADYMTRIADSEGWSTTTDPTLKSYYQDFIHSNAEGGGLMSGSAAHIKAFVAALRAQLASRTDAVSMAIKANIDNNTSIASNTYPRSIGLPDGAAAIRWTKNEEKGKEEFSVRTNRTAFDNINGITRYTYPAALVFFTDSPICTSTAEVPKITYQNTTMLWSAFLKAYYTGPSAVRADTKAVAVVNPLQFGVANLRLTLTGMIANIKDAKNNAVTNASMSTLPLTGVIIGGQHTVGYNMKPQGEQTDVDGRFIYETNITTETAGKAINTLVLQSYDNEKVPILLEFQNDTAYPFTGKDGIVYPGTRFYLIGMIDPAGKGTGAYANRVFTQDYTTTMSMVVSSLANAYTCMPDLLAPRLEVGVQVVTKWIQSTTTNVEL